MKSLLHPLPQKRKDGKGNATKRRTQKGGSKVSWGEDTQIFRGGHTKGRGSSLPVITIKKIRGGRGGEGASLNKKGGQRNQGRGPFVGGLGVKKASMGKEGVKGYERKKDQREGGAPKESE